MYSILLFPGYSLLEFFHLFSLEIASMLFFFSVTDGSFIAIYVMKRVLILHELIIVLLIDWIFLGFDLIPEHHLFVVLIFVPLSFLFLSSFYLFSGCQFFKSLSFLLFHSLFLPYVIFLKCSTVHFMHHPFLFYCSSFFFISSASSFFAQLQVLSAKFMFDGLLVSFESSHLSLHVLLVSDGIFELFSFVHQSIVSLLQFHDLCAVVIISE